MNAIKIIFVSSIFLAISCSNSETERKNAIKEKIESAIQKGVLATKNKDIALYEEGMPDDLLIYDESGEVITKEKQLEYAIRDWAIIDTTLHIEVEIDSIDFITEDSIFVFTSQIWKRMMFRRDGLTLDTVLTTQRHRETWKKNHKGWFGYHVEELGGKIFINGQRYYPE